MYYTNFYHGHHTFLSVVAFNILLSVFYVPISSTCTTCMYPRLGMESREFKFKILCERGSRWSLTPRSGPKIEKNRFLAAQIDLLSQQNNTLSMPHDNLSCILQKLWPTSSGACPNIVSQGAWFYSQRYNIILFWFVQAREHASIASSRNLLEQISCTSSALMMQPTPSTGVTTIPTNSISSDAPITATSISKIQVSHLFLSRPPVTLLPAYPPVMLP